MSLEKSVMICTWYDNNIKSYADIAVEINKKWVADKNEYYSSITDTSLTQYTKYTFYFKPSSEEPKGAFQQERKPHWNRIPLMTKFLHEKKTVPDNDDDSENDYKYDYVMWIDADACMRVNNTYKDLFESIVTKYSCKNIIFSEDKDDYLFALYVSLYILVSILVLMSIVYLFMGFNKKYYYIFFSLFVVSIIILLIMLTVRHNKDISLNSGIIIMKNTKYSRDLIKYWASTDCYENRIQPWQDQGCIRYCYVNNINKMRNNSVILNLGVLQKFKYNPKDTSLIVHFANGNTESRVKDMTKLKNEWL